MTFLLRPMSTQKTRFAVYFRAEGRALPSEDDVRATVRRWINAHAPASMHEGVFACVERGALAIRAIQPSELPSYAQQRAAGFVLPKETREALPCATHALFVTTEGVVRPGMFA